MNTGVAGHTVSFREAARVWLHIGFLSFGGPAGQIALMHKLIVDEKRWIGEERFLHALNYCTLLPGPEAQQLATYIGWLLHGTRGGLVAGTLFILPGALAILALSMIYVTLGHVPLIAGIFLGLKAAVMALVVEAVLRVGRRALRSVVARTVAAVAFLALFVFALPFPLVVVAAGCSASCGRAAVAVVSAAGSHGGSGVRRADSGHRRRSVASRDTGHRSRDSHSRDLVAAVVSADGARGDTARSDSTSSCSRACFSLAWRWSPSAVRMRCSPMWRSARSSTSDGSPARRCSTVSRSRRRRRDR